MRQYRNIITLCLIVFYMLSMAHSLFHNHMHSALAHAAIEHSDHGCGDCCGGENRLDHKHQSDGERSCNLQTQFVPTDQKPKIEVHSIDILSHNFIISAVTQTEAIQSEDFEYKTYSYILPPDPEIAYHSLRAPPAQC